MQRLTERTFYGVPTLSGLPLRKIFLSLVMQQRKSFSDRTGGMRFKVISESELHKYYFNFHTLFAPASHIAPSKKTLFESERLYVPEGKLILDQVIPSEEYQDRFDDP